MRILYLDLDSLRPDHLGCYGYHRDTSPNIDRVAAEGVRFENVYCSDAPCCPSRTALMTGHFGIHNGLVGHGGSAGDLRFEGAERGFRSRLGSESLPAFLRSCGYRTVSISPFAERHSAWSFYAGFSEMYNTGRCGMESAEEVTPTVLKWLGDNAQEDSWFLHINYWDPHMPSRAPDDFGNPFEDSPLPSLITEEWVEQVTAKIGFQMPHHKQRVYARYSKGFFHGGIKQQVPPNPRCPTSIATLDDVRMIYDGYDCGVRYMDGHLGRLLSVLEEQGVLDDTMIIISTDHGENLGELGIFGDHVSADQITMHIPLIIKYPDGLRGHVDSGLHYNLDLAPTLAELHDRGPIASWDGRSYANTVTKGLDTGRSELIVSTCAGTCQRSVRFDQWHYIRTYHDGYNLFPQEMLFNIEHDPHELVDLANNRHDICTEAVYRLNAWHDNMMQTMPFGTSEDPLWKVIRESGPSHVRNQLKKYLEQLEQEGHHKEVEELRRRHPAEC